MNQNLGQAHSDYIGEQLRWDVGNRAYFHLLGFLEQFSTEYQWEPGTAREYILRLFSEKDWAPFRQEYLRSETKTPGRPQQAVL